MKILILILVILASDQWGNIKAAAATVRCSHIFIAIKPPI